MASHGPIIDAAYNWFAGLDKYVIGATTGAFFTLLGTWIQGRAAAKRQREQLDWEGQQRIAQRTHDKAEAEKERLHELKKSHFFPLLEAIPGAIYSLLPYKNFAKDLPESSEEIRKLNRSAATASLIASEPVDQAVRQFDAKLEEFHLELANARSEVVRTKQTYDMLKKDADEHRERLKFIMSAANSIKSGELLKERLTEYVDSRDALEEAEAYEVEAWERLKQEGRTLEATCDKRIAELILAAVECRITVREELGFPLDANALRTTAQREFESLVETRKKYRDCFFEGLAPKSNSQTASTPAPTPPVQPAGPQSGSDDTPSPETAPPED